MALKIFRLWKIWLLTLMTHVMMGLFIERTRRGTVTYKSKHAEANWLYYTIRHIYTGWHHTTREVQTHMRATQTLHTEPGCE